MFDHPEFDAHEEIVFHHDAASGLRAIIAVHSTALGPALGGCRMVDYADAAAALTDVLRLSRGMSYKAALAELPQGGGKSVIWGDPHHDKTDALIDAMGRFVQRLEGRYLIAEDSGTTVADMQRMAAFTPYVTGWTPGGVTADGRTGDPSPATAYGTWVAMRAAWQRLTGQADLRNVRVAVQGLGSVGMRLCQRLHDEGARLAVTDTRPARVDEAVRRFDAQAVNVDAIHAAPVDILSPNALGAVLNVTTIPALQCKLVCGAANNQLATPDDANRLLARGITFAPDYVVSAGGIIDIHHQRIGYDTAAATAHLDRIGVTLNQVLQRAAQQGVSPAVVADQMAREQIARGAHY
ncbi:Glu/Leu/Phe/Val family dehydrogenase [Polycyclovorans algicola]|uniref:Glu/Leu/Phe/Val family dehydrogenase n=1 Tax=Polycyclovorans algicola TaxID=616992 RepID=UPI0004A6BC79|nr:Glu/Leu/Phe/Val dehydrogenase dimerization domain-containing protein [Polycyclovorans algicola]